MARQQYPSDEKRRKTRPHVKIHLTARSHRRTAAVMSDPERRGMLVGLWMLAADAYAGRTGNTVHLDQAAVMWITGRHRADFAATSLRHLCDIMSYPIQYQGDIAVVTVRNFERKQGFDSAARGVTTPTPPPSDSDSDSESDLPSSKTQRGENSAPRSGAPRAKSPRAIRTGVPEALSETDRVELERYAGENEPWAVPRLRELEATALDHARSTGMRCASWLAYVRNWVRRERTQFGRDQGPPTPRGQALLVPAPRARLTEADFKGREVIIR